MKTIKPIENANAKLSEIYSTGFQLSFVSRQNNQCHPWVLCKDFMNDAVWATLHKRRVSIYEFTYDANKHPKVSFSPVKIIVRNKQKKPEVFDKEIKKSIKFLNIAERQHGFQESTVERVKFGDTDQRVYMFKCSKEWIHASPMLSLLTLYIRIGCHYPGGGSMNKAIKYYKNNVKHNDASYLKQCRKMRLLVLKKGLSIFKSRMKDNYPLNDDLHNIHHQWGIVNAPKHGIFKKLWDLKDLDKMGKKKEEPAEKEEAIIKE